MKFYLYPKNDTGWITKWYDTVYNALEKHKQRVLDPDDATLLFPGFDTACETNWPDYGHMTNAFIKGKPTDFRETPGLLRKLEFWNGPKWHVLLDMNPFSGFPGIFKHENVILSANSLSGDNYRKGIDVSFPASPTMKGNDHLIQSEKYFLTFKGAISHDFRLNFLDFHNNKDIIINLLDHNKTNHKRPWVTGQEDNNEYLDLLINTRFSLVLRGDALFSYRLLEIMSLGTIPVIFTHGWILPFSEILDYDSFSVIIDEGDWPDTISILNSYTDEQIKTMRTNVKMVYDKHFSTIEKQVDTLIYILGKLHSPGNSKIREDFENYSKEVMSLHRQGVLFLEDNHLDEAIKSFKSVLRKEPQHIDTLFNMGLAFEKTGDVSQAKDTYKDILAIKREIPEALLRLGFLYLNEANYIMAKECFLDTIKLNKYLLESHLFMSRIYLSMDDLESCVMSCDELLKHLDLPRNVTIDSVSDISRLFINIGQALINQEKETLARFSLEIADLLDPEARKNDNLQTTYGSGLMT